MSTATRSRETSRCEYCDAEFDHGYNAAYCSAECYHAQQGVAQLRNIAHDHRFCVACFRQLKEIERPPEGTSVVVGPVDHDAVEPTARDVLVGFQYRTEHADIGPRETRGIISVEADSPASERAPSPADCLVVNGTICECGTTDHRDDYLRGEHVTDITAAAERLVGILDWVGREGQQDKTVDASRLYRTLEASIREDGEPDWTLAVGRALE